MTSNNDVEGTLGEFSREVSRLLVLAKMRDPEIDPRGLVTYFLTQGFCIALSAGVSRDTLAIVSTQAFEAAQNMYAQAVEEDDKRWRQDLS